jgi:hypothetical protein
MNSGDVDEIPGDGSTSPDLAAGSRLERFAADARAVFDAHVLSRLEDGDRAMLALVSRSMRDVVFDSPDGDVRDVAAVRRELARVPDFVGSIGRLTWAKEQRGCPWIAATFMCIARGGNVEVARWAKERGCPWNEETCFLAAFGGHLKMLQWLRANGAPWGETCAGAAGGGHLEVLKWARANGAPWDEGTCHTAAEFGQLEVLKWARASDPPCPWNEETCTEAAFWGYLEVLKWLRASDPPCPWNESICAYAAEGGYLEMLQWARANGAPWDPERCKARARSCKHEGVLQWIAGEVGEGA